MINSACNWGNYIITGALGLSHWFSSKVKALYIHYSLHSVLSNILLLVRSSLKERDRIAGTSAYCIFPF